MTLERGSTDTEAVKRWQRLLLATGFDPGKIDGSFGDKTEAATRAFQTSSELLSSGRATERTIEVMALVLLRQLSALLTEGM